MEAVLTLVGEYGFHIVVTVWKLTSNPVIYSNEVTPGTTFNLDNYVKLNERNIGFEN